MVSTVKCTPEGRHGLVKDIEVETNTPCGAHGGYGLGRVSVGGMMMMRLE